MRMNTLNVIIKMMVTIMTITIMMMVIVVEVMQMMVVTWECLMTIFEILILSI